MTGRWVDLGLIDYGEAHRLQLELVRRRIAGEVPDLLLLCQHPDVVTVGRREQVFWQVAKPPFPLHAIERGGDATYHGPGQLVGYPILLLGEGERDLHRYLRNLEEGLIQLCARFGVAAGRKAGLTGAWTQDQQRKLASIGIAVRRWVTYHGFALNVTTDLGKFAAIRPCNLDATVMTSLAQEADGDGALRLAASEAPAQPPLAQAGGDGALRLAASEAPAQPPPAQAAGGEALWQGLPAKAANDIGAALSRRLAPMSAGDLASLLCVPSQSEHGRN